MQQVGYLAPEMDQGRSQLHEVILTQIMNVDRQKTVGALILGFPLLENSGNCLRRPNQNPKRDLAARGLHSQQIPATIGPVLGREITARASLTANEEGKFELWTREAWTAWALFRRAQSGFKFSQGVSGLGLPAGEMREATT